jgi:hypothetical protein
MRENLAETLLATVMGWDDGDIARERPILQALADYKYDEYEQFQPGRRFIESLARWLEQFPEISERRTAYRVFRERLIFISRAEMQHLVASVYPDLIRRRLLQRAAADLGVPDHRITGIVRSEAFAVRRRSCLFVGLSDGAHTDVLRRANREISNEQVVPDYHALKDRERGLLEDLQNDLRETLGSEATAARFTTVVLLDDFSASGISYVRQQEPGKGKLARVAAQLKEMTDLLDHEDLQVLIAIYVATKQALTHLRNALADLEAIATGTWRVDSMQCLPPDIVIQPGVDTELDVLIENVYDAAINDRHMQKGGTDGRYGFAGCGLPVVLTHNTPNNSIALLWADTGNVRGLFPRVTRHREDS